MISNSHPTLATEAPTLLKYTSLSVSIRNRQGCVLLVCFGTTDYYKKVTYLQEKVQSAQFLLFPATQTLPFIE